ncbi:serologically defined colon cancer antigen 8 homolog isoform X3 [Cimex lectularius]|uniref:Uncharacterized protein n=1 Tax=Cimex lectularius TaxID=79782 RepID=A0A8I6RQL5_CIMLE|nr:serologically defined colon cancer antigen 8 homolog isoform X3 [Cimex lectularius]
MATSSYTMRHMHSSVEDFALPMCTMKNKFKRQFISFDDFCRRSPKMDLFRKRTTTSDYSDLAYREAVSKLKYLLAESYTPITVQKFTTGGPLYKLPLLSSYEHLGGSDSSIRKYLKPRALNEKKQTELSTKTPPEFMSYMKQQEEYIGHLEKESQSCRDELSKMLEKIRDVIAENEKLREAWKTHNGSGIDDSEEESEISYKDGKKKYYKHIIPPNIVFESRISELEAQLTQSKIELRKAQDEANFLKTQSKIDCSSHYPQENNKQIEALQRERDELNETISNLQSLISQLRDKEASATQKVKRSLDLVDQAHFDKNQVIDADSTRRVNETERRYAMQIERLNNDLATQWDTTNRLNLELDRIRRAEQELRRDLAQKNSIIEDLKKELLTKTSNLQTEALTAGAERETLESELTNSKLAIERVERNSRQEIARLQAEVTSLRQRLDRADGDLLHSRKENLRLTDNIASLEKELELAKTAKENVKDTKRNDDLAAMIKEMDAKHALSVSELEGMIQSQTQLMEKLNNECQMLTERLEDSSARHKEEMASLQSNIEYLNSKLEAPVNYDNQEWRDDGMVNNYGEDTRQYVGTTEDGRELLQGDNYDPNINGGYPQNGKYQVDAEYPNDQVYGGQRDDYESEAYQQGYPEGEAYPQESAYQVDPNYQTKPDTYSGDANNPADPNTYLADTYKEQTDYTTDNKYETNQDYPTTETTDYQPDATKSIPEENITKSDPDPNQDIEKVNQNVNQDITQVLGVDANGGTVVAQQEEFIPQTGQ